MKFGIRNFYSLKFNCIHKLCSCSVLLRVSITANHSGPFLIALVQFASLIGCNVKLWPNNPQGEIVHMTVRNRYHIMSKKSFRVSVGYLHFLHPKRSLRSFPRSGTSGPQAFCIQGTALRADFREFFF